MSQTFFPEWVPLKFISVEDFYKTVESYLPSSEERVNSMDKLVTKVLKFAAAFFLLPVFSFIGAAYHLSLFATVAIMDRQKLNNEWCFNLLSRGVLNLALYLIPPIATGVMYTAFSKECENLYKWAYELKLENVTWFKNILASL